VEGYIHLPETPGDAKTSQTGVWRISLETVDLSYQALALEIAGDVTLGASATCDINANAIWGEGFGISKEHCKLRPTSRSLFLIDLESTNHTYVNGTPLNGNAARSLADKDLITLGRLHLRLKIVEPPPGDPQG
jgi:pSer/pThr/pTyr-binding forkhead associated (FHA) protein